jgi:hypothetical protein
MTDRSVQSELLGLLGRILLLIALLVLTFPTGLSLFLRLAGPRLTSGDSTGAGAGDRSIEIIGPLDGFTGSPRPITRPEEPLKPDDSWARPGERLIVAPDAPEGSWPMVEGLDGRLYQLTPSGRHPVDDIDVPRRLQDDGFERRLFKRDADGRFSPEVQRRWVP